MRITRLLLVLGFSLAVGPVARATDVSRNGHTFHVPDGFTVELAARRPLVDRPIHAAFDEQGRLYVTDSSGSNAPLEKQCIEKPNRIMRLEDTDHDGRFDRSRVFADRMMFPEGAMWFDGSLYVAAPPSIWKFTDTDDDGRADRREEWFQAKTLTHCGNDLHGPYLGPDGWIYWCKGAFATQTYDRPGGKPFVTRAAHIFRCRIDAPRDRRTGSVLTSAIEPVMTGGMDNPVDVVFTPGGERIFTTTFLVRPGGGLRDGLIHAIYGGVYGKRQSAIDGHPRTGELMPVLLHLGAAAPCGLTRYESTQFGDAYRDNLFACLFNMRKVTRQVLKPAGSTFQTEAQDFLVSDNVDFHPTDVIEDADGSLLVIDTGGWYKLCCPTSQLEKPDILGAIYRIRRDGSPQVDDPRGLRLRWSTLAPADLVRLLADTRPAVRRRAVHALAARGPASVPVLSQVVRRAAKPTARLAAVWTLTQIDHPTARAAVRQALGDRDRTVRRAALHSISAWRDRRAVDALRRIVRDGPPPLRRVAAEALGRIGDASAIPTLLAAASPHNDRAVDHALIYALIEIGQVDPLRATIRADDQPAARHTALIALDQIDGGQLEPIDAVPLLTATEPLLRQTAAWIVDHHPEWGGALIDYFREQLSDPRLATAAGGDLAGAHLQTERAASRSRKTMAPDASSARFLERITRFSTGHEVQQWMARGLADPHLPDRAKSVLLRAMARASVKRVPASWGAVLPELLRSNAADLVRDTVALLRSKSPPDAVRADVATALMAIGADPDRPDELRLAALAAVPGGLKAWRSANPSNKGGHQRVAGKPSGQLAPELVPFVIAHLDQENPVAVRAAATDVLIGAGLRADPLIALARQLDTVSPLDIENILQAFEDSSDEKVGLALIAGIEASPARSALRIETLKPKLAHFPEAVQRRAEALYKRLAADSAEKSARLEELLSTLPAGDVRRGQAVFQGSKASCSACHAIGYLGGRVGPDLTRIARIRSRRDLLEAIVFPSASLVRSYEPVMVATDGGKVINGLIRQDDGRELVLATGPNQEVRIPRDTIEEMRQSSVSIMPTGLDKQLSPQQLADLLAFLATTK